MQRKILLTVVAVITLIETVQAQLAADIGVYGGASFYMGDVNRNKLFYTPQLAYGGLFRYNFNAHYALRFGTTITTLKGADEDFDDGYQTFRDYSFKTVISDISLQLDFSFLPYLFPSDNKKNIATYVTTGLTFLIAPNAEGGGMKLAIPMGVGVKYNLTDWLSGGVEWTMHKTTTDYLDQLSSLKSPKPSHSMREKQRTYDNSNDVYSFTGVYLLFKISRQNNSCPAYGNPLNGGSGANSTKRKR